MLSSSYSCSIIWVIEIVTRKTRLDVPLTSTVCPSPLAVTRVFAGTKICSELEMVMAENFNKSSDTGWLDAQSRTVLLAFRRMRRRKIAAAGLFGGLEFHQFDSRQVRIEDIQLTLAVSAHLRMFIAVLFPAV